MAPPGEEAGGEGAGGRTLEASAAASRKPTRPAAVHPGRGGVLLRSISLTEAIHARPIRCRPLRPMPGGVLTMSRIIETVVYGIKELPVTAKESARAWYRQTCLDHEWYDFVFEDFDAVCRILGVTLRTSPIGLMGGGTRNRPHIFFRGYADNRNMPRSPLKAMISRMFVRDISEYSQAQVWRPTTSRFSRVSGMTG